jgi:hypothetical protein
VLCRTTPPYSPTAASSHRDTLDRRLRAREGGASRQPIHASAGDGRAQERRPPSAPARAARSTAHGASRDFRGLAARGQAR